MENTDLRALLKNLQPVLDEKKYSIGTFDEAQLMGIANYIQYVIGIFREEEGITVIFSEEINDEMRRYTEKKLEGPFAKITMKVNSSLFAVGLLAKITECLAKENIPVNAFSAYCHDHILVPYGSGAKALAALKKIG